LFNVTTNWPQVIFKKSVRVGWVVKALGPIIAPGFVVNTLYFKKFHSTRSQSLVSGLVATRKVARAYSVTAVS